MSSLNHCHYEDILSVPDLFDGVHLVPEVCAGRVHVGDHGADVAHDGGEDQHAQQEVDRDEEVLRVLRSQSEARIVVT